MKKNYVIPQMEEMPVKLTTVLMVSGSGGGSYDPAPRPRPKGGDIIP